MDRTSDNQCKHIHGYLWEPIYRALHSKYDVVDYIDVLASGIDIYPRKLYETLLPWQNARFEHNQRLILHFQDTDYYLEPTSPGFLLVNLYRVFAHLNIPSEYVILLHAANNLTESEKLAAHFNMPPMTTIYCPFNWAPMAHTIQPIDCNFEKIQKPFVCLNGHPRTHRLYTLSVMKELEMFDRGMTSLYMQQTQIKRRTHHNYSKLLPLPKYLNLLTLDHHTRINSDLIFNQRQRDLLTKWFPTLSDHQSPLVDGVPNHADTRYQPNFLQFALWNVITETTGEYPYAFYSEKTWKAILTKRPFVLLGGVGSLKQLKKLGFKTFDKWINESYDDQAYFAERCDLAMQQIQPYCAYSTDQLQDQAQDMQEILEFNFNHYLDVFCVDMLEDLINNQL